MTPKPYPLSPNSHLPFISIVIPVHNEAPRILDTALTVCRYMTKYQPSFELLFVENGSNDGTWSRCLTLKETLRPVRIIRLENVRSKAEAVKQGMISARGQLRYMCDCDLSTPIADLPFFLSMAYSGADVVIGSRYHKHSQTTMSAKRRIIGWAFHTFVELYTGMDYKDTQCGFKLFTAQAANLIFPRLQIRSPGFDVEILWLAEHMGFTVKEIPVAWKESGVSTMRLRDGWQAGMDILKLPFRHRNLLNKSSKNFPPIYGARN